MGERGWGGNGGRVRRGRGGEREGVGEREGGGERVCACVRAFVSLHVRA